MLVVTGLTWLHIRIADLSQTLPRDGLAAIDAGAAGNLAAWFSSCLLLMAAACSLQIYNLRRHKIDDYRGRYRIWVWAAIALLFTT